MRRVPMLYWRFPPETATVSPPLKSVFPAVRHCVRRVTGGYQPKTINQKPTTSQKNMNKKLTILSLAFAPLMALAQSFQAKNAEVDLGQVKWKVPATASFTVKNTSSKPLKVTEVDAGSGSTMVEFPKQSIEPGQQFVVKTTYNSQILGHFARTVCVYNEEEKNPLELVFRCHVVTEVKNYSGDYPYKIGGLLTDIDAIEFDDVNKGDVVTQDIHILNPTGQNVSPLVMHLPTFLRAEMMPKTLGPKQSGVLRLTMNSKHLRLLGLNQANIYLAKNVGEQVSEDKEIEVSAVLLPERPADDAPVMQAPPMLMLSADEVDMTNFGKKDKLKRTITVSNKGKSVLDISALQLFTRGIDVILPKRQLRPGESTKMKITGHADILKKVRRRPRILMITNDPTKQKVIIEIKK